MDEQSMQAHAELKKLLEENIELAEENNRLLRAMRRDALIAGILKTLIWVIIIVASFYFSMKFLEPYLGLLEGSGGQMGDWQALIEQYKAQFSE